MIWNFKPTLNSFAFVLVFGLATGCATKLRTPLNRMMTPETVGGALNPEFELSSQNQLEGKVDISTAEPYSLQLAEQRSMGYYAALALLESVDVYWNHTASAASVTGLKWQFMGGSLKQAGAGNSMAIAAGFGGNEHEIEASPKVEFESSAAEVSLLHGYWFTPNIQFFDSFTYAKYTLEGKVSGSGDFYDEATYMTAAGGFLFAVRPYKLKLEMAYTQADWSESGSKSYLSWAMGLGLFF